MKSMLLVTVAVSAPLLSAGPALTIYNRNFAVVRESVPLELEKGVNEVTFRGATRLLEPDSVILRDPSGDTALRVLEQSYRADVLSQGLLLSLHEGQTIDFLSPPNDDGQQFKIKGRIIRSGFTPATGGAAPPSAGSPIIEVDGQLRFSLPGEPLFPTLGDQTILEPALGWKLESDRKGRLDAELSYLTGGLGWQAAYNLVLPEKGETIDMVGWVTLDNRSGRRFDHAVVKLMAGDVNKLPSGPEMMGRVMVLEEAAATPPQVTEKAFDEFHLYSLVRPVTLVDQETKQIELLRGTGIRTKTLYLYDGTAMPWANFRGWRDENFRNDRNLGTQSNSKIEVVREFMNTRENGLGLPLPAGTLRFYRQDDADGRLEFTGENRIDHTPQGERLRIPVGDAFDLVGERKQLDYQLDNRRRELIEKIEITLRNRKQEPVTITVQERLYRGTNWEIIEKTADFAKLDARHVTFDVPVQPDEERTLAYTVRYTW